MRHWDRIIRDKWQEEPSHIRKGVKRLYLVIAVPWFGWFGLQLIVALHQHRSWRAPDLILSLLSVPIALPFLIAPVMWVLAGFRNPKSASPMPWGSANANKKADVSGVSNSAVAFEKYCQMLNNALAQLDDKHPVHRGKLYQKARQALTKQLAGEDAARIKAERRSLEAAIAEVESAARSQHRNERRVSPASTVLLLLSICFPGLWAMDATSMALFWTARLPKAEN